MHKSNFSPFSDPFMLSVDASGVVPVGVRPPPPFGARPPARRDSFSWPSAWRAEGALRPAQNLLNPR